MSTRKQAQARTAYSAAVAAATEQARVVRFGNARLAAVRDLVALDVAGPDDFRDCFSAWQAVYVLCDRTGVDAAQCRSALGAHRRNAMARCSVRSAARPARQSTWRVTSRV